MDGPPTIYKAYNAAVEGIDWLGGNIKPETFFRSVMGGERYRRKSRAWDASVELISV
jgi:hypothetical protein